MKPALLPATLAVALSATASAFSAPAYPGTLKYTFGTVSGGAYCDGLTLTTTDKKTYSGEHTGCAGNVPADGHKAKNQGGSYLDIKTTSQGYSRRVTYDLFIKQNQWEEYIRLNGLKLEVDSGVLIKGAPPNNDKSSRQYNPRALLDRAF